jgi:hypothetical protein
MINPLKPLWKRLEEYRWFNMIRHLSWTVIGVGLLFVIVGITGTLDQPALSSFAGGWLGQLHQGLASGLVGAGLTVIVIDSASRWTALVKEKKHLIHEFGSRDRATTINAARELAARGWLYDGTLEGASLWKANLEGADLGMARLPGAVLVDAHLGGVSLVEAHLEGARLFFAHLEGAFLFGAHLEGAALVEAHLEGASLWNANLEKASLVMARLREATLMGANLKGADLERAHLEGVDLQGAVLPDGTELPTDDTWKVAWRTWLRDHPELGIKYVDDSSPAQLETIAWGAGE